MTLYDKFEEIIVIHGMKILDYPDWCKAAFRKSHHSEKELNTKLFFLLLDKNVTFSATTSVAYFFSSSFS